MLTHVAFALLLHPAAVDTPPLFVQPATCGTGCGTQRWTVKNLGDDSAFKIRFGTPVTRTVSTLRALPKPSSRPRRLRPTEFTIFRVRGYLLGWSMEEDKDFHLVLGDHTTPTKTMVIEIPNPDCQVACRTRFGPDWQALRDQLVNHIGEQPSDAFKQFTRGTPVTVTGVGFFDAKCHGTGSIANGIELHPVLTIRFDNEPLLSEARTVAWRASPSNACQSH